MIDNGNKSKERSMRKMGCRRYIQRERAQWIDIKVERDQGMGRDKERCVRERDR